MSHLAIRLDDLDRLTGLLPDCTTPRAVADIVRAAVKISTPDVAIALQVSAPVDHRVMHDCFSLPEGVGGQDGAVAEGQREPAEPLITAETRPAAGEGWTEKEKQTLAQLWTEGAEVPDIVAALPGRTPRSIGEMRRRLALRARAPRKAVRAMPAGVPWTDAEDAVVMRMWSEGASLGSIAAALPGRTAKAIQVRKARLQAQSDAAAVAASKDAAAGRPDGDVVPASDEGRTLADGLSEGAALIFAAMAELDESFEPADDKLLVEERFKGAAIGGIAEQLGCDEATVAKRWKQIRGCKVDNKGGLMTDKGWADLRAAAGRRAAQAEA